MMVESQQFAHSCLWFSSLVSKESFLKYYHNKLMALNVSAFKVIKMGQGNKTSRILAWTFADKIGRQKWSKTLSNKVIG